MSSLSVIGAVETKVRTFTDAPDVYLFDTPVSVAGAQVYPPYVALLDPGLTPTYEIEHTVMEQTDLELRVYGNSLAQVDAIVEIIKYNGGTIGQALGLDFGTLPDLDPRLELMELRRTSEQRWIAVPTGQSAQRIFGCTMRYTATVYRYS